MKDNPTISRRHFLGDLLKWVDAGGASLMTMMMGWRFLAAPFGIRQERKIFCGTKDRIPQGILELKDAKLALIREGDSIRALSLECTHLGCTVRKTDNGFVCPCHGSRFAKDGSVLHGPATRRLAGYRVLAGDDQKIFVDAGQLV